ncbi:unnamed protein product, partial [Closterium sp. Naga37s-1]
VRSLALAIAAHTTPSTAAVATTATAVTAAGMSAPITAERSIWVDRPFCSAALPGEEGRERAGEL